MSLTEQGSSANLTQEDAMGLNHNAPGPARVGFVVLTLIIFGTYFTRMSSLPVRGEESRRANVAREMITSGQWIVPRLQGDLYFMSARPPLHNWLIAAAGLVDGSVDIVAVRLPSAIAVCWLAAVIYLYSSRFLPPAGAVCTAAVYATFGQVLELGRLGETDLVFSACLASALLLWHRGLIGNFPAWQMWATGYSFAALATLAKGPQAPVYFVASVTFYLLITRRWKVLFSRAHLVGIAHFLLILGSWQIPFFLQEGINGVRHVYLGDVALYGRDIGISKVIKHLVSYPIEIVAGCLLPWSFFLFAYFRKEIRSRNDLARDPLIFALCCLAITFPSVWFVTGARTRFYMPLYPSIAVIIGIAMHRIWEQPRLDLRVQPVRVLMAMISVTAVVVAVMAIAHVGRFPLADPLPWTLAALVGAGVAVVILWRNRFVPTPVAQLKVVLATAGCVGAFIAGPFTNARLNVSIQRAELISRVRSAIPATAIMYSLDRVDHCFAFEYGGEIRRCEWPQSGESVPDEMEYFCFRTDDHRASEQLPFAWEPVGVVSIARIHDSREFDALVAVGHRMKHGNTPTTKSLTDYYRQSRRTSLDSSVLRNRSQAN